jgi:formylglycine-generating enzyme required for sulfatase activity
MILNRILLACLTALLATSITAGERPGLLKEKPTEGRFVETDQGFMVAYDVTIPGTEVTFRMVPVPGGEYLMGSPPEEAGHVATEGPLRRVSIEPFWMAECEAAWAEYKPFMALYTPFKEFQSLGLRKVTDENRVDAITAPTPLYEPDFTFEHGEEPRQAAVTMTQYAAKQYSKWMTGITGVQMRLPTEAEWEFACRGGTNTAYHFGDDPTLLQEYGWFSGNTDADGTRFVGLKKPNQFGLHDMHGNAAEWVLDGFAPYEAQGGILNGSASWIQADTPDNRVVRGGSWEFEAAECRSAARLASDYEVWKEYDPNLPLSPWWCTTDPARGVGFRLIAPLRIVSRERMEDFWKVDSEDLMYDVDDRLLEGRGVLGLVDKDLPAAIQDLSK